jgi:hypothetical protein
MMYMIALFAIVCGMFCIPAVASTDNTTTEFSGYYDELVDTPSPLLVTYPEYKFMVVKGTGFPQTSALSLSMDQFRVHDFEGIYFEEGFFVLPDGEIRRIRVDLSSPPKIARAIYIMSHMES